MAMRIILRNFFFFFFFFWFFVFGFDYGELTILVGNTVKVNTVVWMEILERF